MREGLLCRFDARLEFPAHLIEHMRRCALKRVDRLFLVADGEEGANPVTLALARREILGDLPQDLPLLGRGVLRLVDENVVDSRVELIENPGRIGAGEQNERALDEIIEIKQTAHRFRSRVIGENCLRERDERKGALDRLRSLVLFDEIAQAMALLIERGAKIGMGFAQRLRQVAVGTRLTFLREKHAQVSLAPGAGLARPGRPRQAVRT